jgi:hypothetical protein
MSKLGKTFKDTKEQKALKHEKEPKPEEKGGHRNLIREALEEAVEDLEIEETDELPNV